MPRYVILPCITPLHEHFIHCGAVIEADSVPEACAEAADMMRRESSEDLDPEYLDTLHAIEFTEFKVMEAVPHYIPADERYPCCGGSTFTEDGHTGHCPHHERPDHGEG